MLDELAGEQPGQEPMRFFERLKAKITLPLAGSA
jgi:hypothetical protein